MSDYGVVFLSECPSPLWWYFSHMVFNLGFADTSEFNISDYYCVMCLFLALEKEPIALTKPNISASSNSLYIIVSCICFVICVVFCEIVFCETQWSPFIWNIICISVTRFCWIVASCCRLSHMESSDWPNSWLYLFVSTFSSAGGRVSLVEQAWGRRLRPKSFYIVEKAKSGVKKKNMQIFIF